MDEVPRAFVEGICETRMSLMKGDGDESGDRDLLSLGSTSRSTSSSQGEVFPTKQASAGVEDESMYLTMLCSLSRNGLNMLAGGANGGFSLKSPAIGNLDVTPGISGLRNLSLGAGSERTSTVSGGGFTEFYRSSVPKIRSSLSETGLRSVSDDIKVNGEGRESPSHREEIGRISGKVGFPLKSDVTNLSTDACWRLILKLVNRGRSCCISLQMFMGVIILFIQGCVGLLGMEQRHH